MSATPLDRLLTSGAAVPVGATAVDGFLASPGASVLVFTGDPATRPEAQDVAVIAQELKRQVPRLTVGVVPFADEAELRPRFGVQAVPTVVFVKDGRPASTVSRVQDWAVYARTASVLFGRAKEATP